MIKLSEIAELIDAECLGILGSDMDINKLIIDSRSMVQGEGNIFIALEGNIHDGHQFITDVYQKGVRNFIITKEPESLFSDATYFLVDNAIEAMQLLAKERLKRSNLKHKVAITGSNGKTIVKEWLSQILQAQFHVVKSPKSYNSQIGVPLSIWEVEPHHQIAVFEVGISESNEMDKLYEIIKPDIGIFTHLGDAHDIGFGSVKEKIHEKLILFQSCETVIIPDSEKEVLNTLRDTFPNKEIINWSDKSTFGDLKITGIQQVDKKTYLEIIYRTEKHELVIPFIDAVSIENAINSIVCAIHLEMDLDRLKNSLKSLERLNLRLKIVEGVHQSTIINDTYNADLSSLENGLSFVTQQYPEQEKVLIVSEFDQISKNNEEFVKQLSSLLDKYDINSCITVGKQLNNLERIYSGNIKSFESTKALIDGLDPVLLFQKIVLVKGARRFGLERLVEKLGSAFHSTTLEIDFEAIAQNLSYYASKIGSKTKLMGVIKAAGYGSGASMIAKFLEYKKVDYLAVANIDEGIALRNSNIRLPIVILNPGLGNLPQLQEYNLEPEIYTFDQLEEIFSVEDHLSKTIKIHLKIDTGMHRLGFLKHEVDKLIALLQTLKYVQIESIFTHLAASDDPEYDDFSKEQLTEFDDIYGRLSESLGHHPIKHALNTSGIERFPDHGFDMVRIGLGLYGLNQNLEKDKKIALAHKLSASIIQIKKVPKDATVGYGRVGKVDRDSLIAVTNIGYADGFLRASGNGKYSFRIGQYEAPIVGNVSMDSTMIDVTHIPNLQIGDRVTVFGDEGGIFKLAKINQTIPYEIISRISSRVKRIYSE